MFFKRNERRNKTIKSIEQNKKVSHFVRLNFFSPRPVAPSLIMGKGEEKCAKLAVFPCLAHRRCHCHCCYYIQLFEEWEKRANRLIESSSSSLAMSNWKNFCFQQSLSLLQGCLKRQHKNIKIIQQLCYSHWWFPSAKTLFIVSPIRRHLPPSLYSLSSSRSSLLIIMKICCEMSDGSRWQFKQLLLMNAKQSREKWEKIKKVKDQVAVYERDWKESKWKKYSFH